MIKLRFASTMLLLAIFPLAAFACQEKTAEPAMEGKAADAAPAWRGEFRSIKIDEEPASNQRAWETRPYQVAVWVCLDGDPSLIETESEICSRIETDCQLLDPSGWNVSAGTPPSQWRWKLLNSAIDDSMVQSVLAEPELEFYDKLIVVRVAANSGSYEIDVREIDARTRQIGPGVSLQTELLSRVGALSARLSGRAFMPIARIDEVSKPNKKGLAGLAEMRARGIEACVRTEINEDLQPEVVTIANSPCFIRSSDRLLPVVVSTDRSGKITKLAPEPFTFIAIDDIEDTVINGSIYSSSNSALSNRKSKRAEKLALVIRPGNGSTVLRLVSRGDKQSLPLEGYNIVTVEPNDITRELEYHGKTDWRGEIEIPQSDDMRMLLVRRGGRRLKKIPVIPGFRDELETTVTKDETSLLASGVVTGFENEILSLAVLRRIYQKEIETAIKDGKTEQAREILQTYSDLENPQDLRARMADEEIRLKGQTGVQREKQYIQKLFSPLKKIASSDFIKNAEAEIRKWIDSGNVPKKPEVSEEEAQASAPVKGSG